jgi:TRAP-type C4-dicarboxylate transport system substrate-binding protein
MIIAGKTLLLIGGVMMKKRIIFALVICILAALPLLSACGGAQPAQTIELKYANFFPPTNLHSVLAEQFCQEIESRTNGAVKFDYFPAGALTPAPQTYEAVIEGIADVGFSVLAYTMGRFPVMTLVDMPQGYPNGWIATMVTNDFYNEYKPVEFNDTHLLYFHAHGPGIIFTTKKPVRQLEDMKGLVIRSTGVGAKVVEALGAEGYAAAQNEAYELMSKGTIDGSFTPREVLKGWNQAEVVKYVTGCYDIGYTASMFVTMNKDKWESLPGNIQKVFNQVSDEWIDKHGKVWTYYDKAGIDYFLSMPDRELIELPEAEMARWVAAVKPVKSEYINEITGKGFDGAKYDEYLMKRIDYWTGKSPTEAECYQWVVDNIPMQ